MPQSKKKEAKKPPKAKAKKSDKKPFWKEKTFRIGLIIALIGIFLGGIWEVVLTRVFPSLPSVTRKKVPAIQHYEGGSPLLEIIKKIEEKTDYDVITEDKVEEFKIFGDFEGDDWIQILKRVVNAYDKELKLEIDEKNRKIRISRTPVQKPPQTKK